jgi:ABC-type multidrug transport system fused ATPase/permease subunit
MTKEESLHSLMIYGAFGIASESFFFISFILIAIGCYNASSSFHKQLINSILRAPMSFFDKTPLGRIMNRFSMDIEILDTSIVQSYGYLFLILAETIRLFASIFSAIPILMPFVIPLILTCIFVCRYFNAASAQFRRIASNSMSMVCSAVQDAYSGASSIRVYNSVQRFRNQFAQKLDHTVESNTVEIIGLYQF